MAAVWRSICRFSSVSFARSVFEGIGHIDGHCLVPPIMGIKKMPLSYALVRADKPRFVNERIESRIGATENSKSQNRVPDGCAVLQ